MSNGLTTDLQVKASLDRVVLEALLPVAQILVLLFVVFTVFDMLTLPSESRVVVVGYDFVLGLVFLVMSMVLRRGLIPASWANGMGALMALLTSSNSLLTMYVADSVVFTPLLMMVMLAIGAMLISMRWVLVALSLCFMAWLVVVWPFTHVDELILYCIFMVVAFTLAVALQSGRERTQRRLLVALAESRHARANAESLAQLAETASQAKGEFLANISHETRTPIHGVLGMTEILLAEGLDREQKERVETIRDSTRALLSLVNEVLDFSKGEAGQLRLEQVAFQPRLVLNEVSRLLAPLAHEKDLAWHVAVDEGVPEWFRGDAGRLRQILLNIMGNAIKFTSHGSVRSNLRLLRRGLGENRILRFDVCDSGPSVPVDLRDKLFDPFFQQDGSDKRAQGGTGLGLSIARQLVLLMGGEIGVEESSEGGACFWFTVELLESDAKNIEGDVAESLEGRILVVDDHPINQRVAQAALCRVGLNVQVVGSGPDALEHLGLESYDLVLLDVQMPGMDGMEVLHRIRTDESGRFDPHIPVLAVTAHASENARQRFLDAGMDGFVAKPFDAQHLLEEVKLQLGRR
ncbi:MAG: response regulator [Deltaproteobacteria bacterium]|nr:response regulator [Deltaproteobacteria bacterium]